MTYQTKNITFHMRRVKVSSKSRCSRTLPMNVANKFVQGLGLVEDAWKALLNMIKGRALYQIVILV